MPEEKRLSMMLQVQEWQRLKASFYSKWNVYTGAIQCLVATESSTTTGIEDAHH